MQGPKSGSSDLFFGVGQVLVRVGIGFRSTVRAGGLQSANTLQDSSLVSVPMSRLEAEAGCSSLSRLPGPRLNASTSVSVARPADRSLMGTGPVLRHLTAAGLGLGWVGLEIC